MESGKAVGWEWDLRTNRDIWFGDLQTMFGISGSSYVGRIEDFRRRVHPDDRGLVWKAVNDAITSHQPYVAEFRVLWPDSTIRWVAAKGQFYYSADGVAERMLGMAVDITDRKRAEEALSSVNRRLIEAQEAERARIARDLHDDIGQRLALLAVTLDQLESWQSDRSDDARRFMTALRKQVTEITDSVRGLAHGLHSPSLRHLGIVAAMKGFCKELAGQQSVEIDFRDADVPPLSQDISSCLFRVMQEAVRNAVRHSRVRRFDVQLRGTADAVHLTVSDGGDGFDVDAAARGGGLGLTSMKERMKLVGGELAIESCSNRGTTVLARVPLAKPQSRSGTRSRDH